MNIFLKIRSDLSETQTSMARLLGVSKQSVSHYEGFRRTPLLIILQRYKALAKGSYTKYRINQLVNKHMY